ncbi:MAG: hypothetical protein ACKOYH_01475 [Cyanobium sp.]
MNSPQPSPADSRLERILLAFFGIAFVARLAERLAYFLSLNHRLLDVNESYALTEWLVNYSGGFVRRGFVGQILLWAHHAIGIGVNLAVIVIALGAFAGYSFLVFRQSRRIAPAWVLLTTPILGYAVYMDGIMLRKDVFLLLGYFLVVALVVRARTRLSDLLIALLLSGMILVHELAGFIAIPSIIVLSFMKECMGVPGSTGVVPGSSMFLRLAKHVCAKCLSLMLPLAMPLAVMTAVIHEHGNSRIAMAIMDSWRSAYAPKTIPSAPAGAVAWLAMNMQDGIDLSAKTLGARYLHLPYWLLLALAAIAAIMLITMVLARMSPVRAWFFLSAAIVQFIAMSSLFYFTCDHPRWVVIAINSAWIISVLTPIDWQEFYAMHTLPAGIRLGSRLPVYFAPLGLAIWGFPFSGWSFYQWLDSSPAGLLLQIYFYLRNSNVIPRLSLHWL